MQKYLIAAVLLVGFVAPVFAAETFYIVFDATLHGCTIATAEPAEQSLGCLQIKSRSGEGHSLDEKMLGRRRKPRV